MRMKVRAAPRRASKNDAAPAVSAAIPAAAMSPLDCHRIAARKFRNDFNAPPTRKYVAFSAASCKSH